MPCQCNALTPGGVSAPCDCGSSAHAEGACECGGGPPTPTDRGASLERVVMELDKRVRALESSPR